MSQQIKTGLGVAIIIIFAAIVGAFVWQTQKNQPEISQPVISTQNGGGKTNNQKVCTQEAKLCPDGSSVSRTGSNCEFAACPGAESDTNGSNCPQYAPPAPGWCSDGIIIAPTKNLDGCFSPPRCKLNNNSCQTDNDCACGRKIDTGECFFGNKKYVNTSNPCPDFCGGIAGGILIKCINNICVQQHE